MTTPDRNARLAEIARIAVKLERETGFPPQMLIAQWAHESAWGSQPVGHYNVFGIKCARRHAICVVVMTHEVIKGVRVKRPEKFADFDSLEAACRDYVWMIRNVAIYRDHWLEFLQGKDVGLLIVGVAGEYATNPQYAQLALQISKQKNVATAIAEARRG